MADFEAMAAYVDTNRVFLESRLGARVKLYRRGSPLPDFGAAIEIDFKDSYKPLVVFMDCTSFPTDVYRNTDMILDRSEGTSMHPRTEIERGFTKGLAGRLAYTPINDTYIPGAGNVGLLKVELIESA